MEKVTVYEDSLEKFEKEKSKQVSRGFKPMGDNYTIRKVGSKKYYYQELRRESPLDSSTNISTETL